MKLASGTIATLLLSWMTPTTAIGESFVDPPYTLQDDCYETNGNYLCEDFCGPGRHFWLDLFIGDWRCLLTTNDQAALAALPLDDCKAFADQFCDHDSLLEQLQGQDADSLREKICDFHCDRGVVDGEGAQSCRRGSVGGWECAVMTLDEESGSGGEEESSGEEVQGGEEEHGAGMEEEIDTSEPYKLRTPGLSHLLLPAPLTL